MDSNPLEGAFSATQTRNRELSDANAVAEQAEQEYQRLIDVVPESYLVTDATGRIVRANQAARRLLNLTKKRPSPRLAKFITPSARPAFKKQFQTLFTSSVKPSEQKIELALKLARGTAVRYAATVRVLAKDSGDARVSWILQRKQGDGAKEVAPTKKDAPTKKHAPTKKKVPAKKHAFVTAGEMGQAPQQASQFTALFKSMHALSHYNQVPDLLARVVEHAQALVQAETGVVLLYDEPRAELAQFAGWGKTTRQRQAAKLGTRLAHLVVPPRSDSLQDSDTFPQSFSQTANPSFPRAIGIPMHNYGVLIGVIVVADKAAPARIFSAADVQILSLFASQAASAIDNANLFEQVRGGRERLKVLSHQLLHAQETERRNVARQLHDEIGQTITAVSLHLQTMQRQSGDVALKEQLKESIAEVETVLQQVRSLSRELHPAVLEDLGLVAALEWFLLHRAKPAGLESIVIAPLLLNSIPPEIEITCFRVAQEAVTNVLRHANARRVEIELLAHPLTRGAHERKAFPQSPGSDAGEEWELDLIVRDDGKGFDVAAAQARAMQGASLGLLGMQERVELVGGTTEYQSAPGEGTRVRARFPIGVSDHRHRGIDRRKRARLHVI